MKTFTKQNIDFGVFLKLENSQKDPYSLSVNLEILVLINGVKLALKVPRKILFKVLELKENDEVLIYWKETEDKKLVLNWIEVLDKHFYN